MPDTAITKIVEQSIERSFQQKPKAGGGSFLATYMARAGLTISAWWTPSRDIQLRNFWKGSDHVAGAIYTMQSKMQSIPFRVRAKDQSNKNDVRDAELWTTRLQAGAEWGEGWASFMGKYVEDLVSQDNGGFFEIIGAGDPAGPLLGWPVTVKHLDAGRCQRTGDPVYPVIFRDTDGRTYKLHASRVGYISQMSSPIKEMYGVGFCSVSRAIHTAQSLVDQLVYKQEKLGSRPRRAVGITKGGLDPEDVAEAFKMVEHDLDSQALSRYSKIALVGDSSLPDADMSLIDMASLPDGFDEETSFNLGIAVLALAFGLDARELAPAMVSGATRADALLQHLKQRGKGPGQIIQITEQLFNFKVLPNYLELVFDFQDDEQDRQAAETKEVRARRWKTSVSDNTLDQRTVRQQMMEVGDLDRSQYEHLELQDGRLADGTDVLALFFSEDAQMRSYLRLGIADFSPFDIDPMRADEIRPALVKRMEKVQEAIVNSKNQEERWKAMQALAALQKVEKALLFPGMPEQLQQAQQVPIGGAQGANSEEGLTHPDERMRKVDPLAPSRATIKIDQKLEPDSDDDVKGLVLSEAKEGSAEAAFPFRSGD